MGYKSDIGRRMMASFKKRFINAHLNPTLKMNPTLKIELDSKGLKVWGQLGFGGACCAFGFYWGKRLGGQSKTEPQATDSKVSGKEAKSGEDVD